MKKFFLPLVCLFSLAAAAQEHKYQVVATFHIASAGGWDYISVHDHNLYASHGNQVNILNAENGDSISYIPNTEGVHGITFDDKSGKGFTSNGRSNSVTVFDLKTNKTVAVIPIFGENPDAILFEPFTSTVISCNGRSKNLSLIDPTQNKVIKTIELEGKPETAVSDNKGRLFVNIEDKNEIAEINLKTYAVQHYWPLAGAEGPTGLAYDANTKRLFAGCEKQLVVVNAENGRVVTKLPIGEGCDGVAFNRKNKIIFTSNGEGTLSAIKENTGESFEVLGNYPTKRGARTIGLDESTGDIYLPTADSEPNTPPGTRPKMIPGTFQILRVK